MKTAVAFDFGASSGRAIKATFENGKISYEEIHRFDNIPLTDDGHIRHNFDMIVEEIKKALDKVGKIDSFAFDTWGVDYGLIGEDGNLVAQPFHYRDSRTDGTLARAKEIMPENELYSRTGNQIMPINTLFQLMNEAELGKAKSILFMPDLFAWAFTGNKNCEYTIASTSQMLSPLNKDWDSEVMKAFEINQSLFAPLCKTASVVGEYNGAKVIAVAGHDTQCAVAAMPAKEGESPAFLSCGTWSLIGCELDEPILSDESNALELSNELGANGKINYLKNISGLWLIQELRRNLNAQGNSYSYNDLEQEARKSESFKCFIDPDAPELSQPGNLAQKIKDYCAKTGQAEPQTVGETVRCIYESLALKYRYAINQITHCTGKKFDILHLLGGGTKDNFLCEMAADSLGIPVCAGPVEATALGNIILQFIALGEIESVDEGRRIIAENEKLFSYSPNGDASWDEAYERYVNIIENNKEEK